MALSNKDRNALNRNAQVVINFLGLAQENYLTKNGEYFQLLISPEQPFDMSIPQDLGVRHPNDERWVEDKIASFVAAMPFQVHVNEHHGGVDREYRGYTIHFTATVGDQTYTRQVKSDGTDSDWQLYVETL